MDKQKMIKWLNAQALATLEDSIKDNSNLNIEYMRGQFMTYIIVAQEICMGKFDV